MTRDAALGVGDEGEPSLVLGIVYLILIGQTLAVLVMYYMRAFMLAFLITIFPLVGMTYVIDKMGDGKTQSFGIWFKEFVVNVIVQLFHALVYVLITGGVVSQYIKTKGGNFVFLIICVLFLFEGEKILRGIFNINSKAKTIGDLATSGAMVIGLAGGAGKLLKRDKNETGSAQDKSEDSAAKNRLKSKTKSQQDNEAAAAAALNDKKERTGSSSSDGEYTGKDNEPDGVTTPEYDGESARDKVLAKAMKRRLKGGVASGIVNTTAGAAGAALMSTREMANGGFDNPAKMFIGAAGGKELGKAIAKPLVKGINYGERVWSGEKLARQIKSGSMNKTLGLENIGAPTLMERMSPDFDEKEAQKQAASMQEIYQEALRRYASAAARGGQAKGEIAYWNYLENELRK